MLDVMGPYALPTKAAGKQLASLMKQRGNQWWVPFPLNETESADFRGFLQRKGVKFVELAPLFEQTIEADSDLCPYVFAWRFLRGELTFTPLGRSQYACKEPFASDPAPESR